MILRQALIVWLAFILYACASTVPLTPLIESTMQSDVNRIEQLLKSGADINEPGGRYGETALMAASRKGNFDIVKLLISKGADVNAKGTYGDTALIAASWGCQLDIVKYLIEKNAKINEKNKSYGSTALNIVAGDCDDARIIRQLLDNGADLNIKNNGGDSPFFSAVKHGNVNSIAMLLETGAYINERNKNGYTALMIATLKDNKSAAAFLIDKHIDINAKNDSGETALSIAIRNKHSAIVELLRNAGAKEEPKRVQGVLQWINSN